MILSNEQRAHDWAIEAMKSELDLQQKAVLANQTHVMVHSLDIYMIKYNEALRFFNDKFGDS